MSITEKLSRLELHFNLPIKTAMSHSPPIKISHFFLTFTRDIGCGKKNLILGFDEASKRLIARFNLTSEMFKSSDFCWSLQAD